MASSKTYQRIGEAFAAVVIVAGYGIAIFALAKAFSVKKEK